MINEESYWTAPFKLATDTKTSISHLSILFFLCVLWKDTAHVGRKALNMRHQAEFFSRYLCLNSTASKMVSCLYTTQMHDCIFAWGRFWWEFLLWFGVQITTIFRINGYVTDSIVHNICYIFKGTKWRYNTIHTVWREEFTIKIS